MPTEEELEQMVNEHLDREKAVESIENVARVHRSERKGTDD